MMDQVVLAIQNQEHGVVVYNNWKFFKILLVNYILLSCGCIYSQNDYPDINPNVDSIFILPNTQQSVCPQEFNSIGKMYFFCKIWGLIKFHNKKNIHAQLDKLLPLYLSKIDSCDSRHAYNEVITDFICQYERFDIKYPITFDSGVLRKYSLIDNAWILDTTYLEPSNRNLLINIWNKFSIIGSQNDFLYQSNIGYIQYNDDFSLLKSFFKRKERIEFISTRFTGLFNFWNLIYYFYPYKNLMSKNWDSTLLNAIPLFSSAVTERDYNIAILKLKSNLDDNHATASSAILTPQNLFGKYCSNFDLYKLSDTFLVDHYHVKDYIDSSVLIGDRIISINGNDIVKLYDSLKNYFSSSNEASRIIKVNKAILMSSKSINDITLIRNKKLMSVKVKYYNYNLLWNKYSKNQNNLSSSIKNQIIWYHDSCAYTHINWLTKDNINNVIQTLYKSKSIIIDFRGYPNFSCFLKLADFLLPTKKHFYISYYPDKKFPGILRWKNGYSIGNNDSFYYRGKIVLIVDANTQSLSEFAVMGLQSNEKVITIGSTTAGSDGNAAEYYFPGNVKTTYSGVGILYPNFLPTQRKGIKIDLFVKPTNESIISQNDIYITRAVNFLNVN